MRIDLFVRRLGDDDSLMSGLIDVSEWLAVIEEDDDLRLRTEDHVARNPITGQEIRMKAQPAESELRVDDAFVPFLVFRSGYLTTGYSEQMDDSEDPVRRKIGSVARTLNAVISHDAGDGYLDW